MYYDVMITSGLFRKSLTYTYVYYIVVSILYL